MKDIAEMDGDITSALDAAVADLNTAKDSWARTPISERIAILQPVKDQLMLVAEGWALMAARKKQIPADSPLVGEEWLSEPYAVMGGVQCPYGNPVADGRQEVSESFKKTQAGQWQPCGKSGPA